MLNVSDVFFSEAVPMAVKQAVLDLIAREHIRYDVQVLTPTASNDDVNGSQHAVGGGTDFTYRDATEADVAAATGLGFYEYFASEGAGYTGHAYDGWGARFAAVVVDPPAYAVSVRV